MAQKKIEPSQLDLTALQEAIGTGGGGGPIGALAVTWDNDTASMIDSGYSSITDVQGAIDYTAAVIDALDAGKANAAHTHGQGDITGLAASLSAKANATHGHVQGDITGLTAALAAKANTAHNHLPADITGLGETITDLLATSIVAGAGINLVIDDAADTVTISAPGGGGGSGTHQFVRVSDFDSTQEAIETGISSGRPVYIDGGERTYTASNLIEGSVTIFGDGTATVCKAANGMNDYVFKYAFADHNTRVHFYDLKIDGNSANQTTGGGGILANGAVQNIFFNVHFTNCFDWGLVLGGFQGGAFGHHNKVLNCLFDSTVTGTGLGSGLHMTSSDENVVSSEFQYLGGTGTPNPACIKDSAGLQTIVHSIFVGARGFNGDNNTPGTNTRGVWLDTGNKSTVALCTFDGVGGDNVFVKGNKHRIIGNMFTFIGDQGVGKHSGVLMEFAARQNVVALNTFDAADAGANGTRSYIREGDGAPGDNIYLGNVLTDSVDLSNGKIEINNNDPPVSQRIGNIGITNDAATGGRVRQVTAFAAPVTAAAAANTDYRYIGTGTNTITMPTANANTNDYLIVNDGTGTITIAPAGGQTVGGLASIALAPGESLTLFAGSTTNWITT